jgi:hypothetical protein
MRNARWLIGFFAGLALMAGAQAQVSISSPTNNILALSNVTGEVRVLKSGGLILETNFVYLPHIKITDLSATDLRALLETKTAYDALTVFGSVLSTNAQSAVIENQLQQIWTQGKSLADKIQTRLEILDDMRAYNADLVYLPSSEGYANQTAIRSSVVDTRQALKAEAADTAAAQVENTEELRAAGDASRRDVHDAREDYQAEAARLERANNKAYIADYQSAAASQQVTDYINKCTEISTRLASLGITISTSPPFYPVPPLSMRNEVDAERMSN